ncbi:ankyrin repeat-containing domain protein [Podospora aff. communis PSN243]|uniref:Ankyrin repeat-containing domain protein n=1 Tax=Podospora aff. communis PSN243 TaxID=3040156 RepID=A0AAV9G814_9PEZI|nr:ankyrin repeat-containing domain protein [Podospora aff. communis PSN243]
MTQILDLPAEILHMVLVQAILNRTYVQALRLKLVCKRFRETFQPALFASRRLDFREERPQRQIMAHWQIRQHHGADKMWHQYIQYLVLVEKGGNNKQPYADYFYRGDYGQKAILCLANEFCAETGISFDETVSALCWLVLDQAADLIEFKGTMFHVWQRPFAPETNLLSLAAYFDHEPLARRLLAKGRCPSKHTGLLPSPTETAAFAGNARILKLFQEHLPDYGPENMPRYKGPRSSDFDPSYRCKVDPGAIYGAALRGDLDMLKLALYPPSRFNPESDEILGVAFGKLDKPSLPEQYLSLAAYVTRNWEVFQYIASALGGGLAAKHYSLTLLKIHAEFGNLDMVRGLLNEGIGEASSEILRLAVRGCHEDVVDLLLEQGVVPDAKGEVLNAAVAAGSLALVKKLVAHGADVNLKEDEVYRLALATAIELEHTDMIRYLLSLRKPTAAFREHLISNLQAGVRLKDWGLNSMLQFVRNDFGGYLTPKKGPQKKTSTSSSPRQTTRSSSRIQA